MGDGMMGWWGDVHLAHYVHSLPAFSLDLAGGFAYSNSVTATAGSIRFVYLLNVLTAK